MNAARSRLDPREGVKPSQCPACRRPLNAATGDGQWTAPGETPKPGDLTICMPCGAFLKFGPDLQLLRLGAAEFYALPDDERGALMHARSRRGDALSPWWKAKRPQS